MEIPESLLEELSRNPAVALPMDHLARLVGDTPASPEDLHRGLARRPDLLRVVEVWRAALSPLGPHPSTLPPEVQEALERQGLKETRWVVPLGPARPRRERWVLRRTRETVRYLGRIVDPESSRAVIRWMRIVREGRLLEEPEE